MARNTRARLVEIFDSIDNHLINVKSQCSHMIYVFQQAEENYNTVYAEQIIMLQTFMEATETLRLAFLQFKDEHF